MRPLMTPQPLKEAPGPAIFRQKRGRGPWPASPLERIGGKTAGVETADDKQAAGVGFLGGLVNAGGDEQIGEARSPEGAGGGFQTRHRHAVELVAGNGIETRDAAAVAERDPQSMLQRLAEKFR